MPYSGAPIFESPIHSLCIGSLWAAWRGLGSNSLPQLEHGSQSVAKDPHGTSPGTYDRPLTLSVQSTTMGIDGFHTSTRTIDFWEHALLHLSTWTLRVRFWVSSCPLETLKLSVSCFLALFVSLSVHGTHRPNCGGPRAVLNGLMKWGHCGCFCGFGCKHP